MDFRTLLAAFLVASATLVPSLARATPATVGGIVMIAPDAWKMDQDPAARPDRPSLRFQPATGKDFYVLVTPFRLAPTIPVDQAGVRKLVESVAATTGAKTVEKTLVVQSLSSATVQGYYFSATNPAPAEGDWKYMTQGIMLVGKNTVGFTVFTNDKASSAPAQALAMLRSARTQ
jgi:hypothetical protein